MNSQKFSIDHEPLEVELLIRSDQRHVTVDHHHAERQRIASAAAAAEAKARQLEAILHPVGIAETDPLDLVVDRPPARRKEADVKRVLQILDEIDREGGEG